MKKKRQLKKGVTKGIIYLLLLSIPFSLLSIYILITQFILLNILYFKGNEKVLYKY